MTQRHARQIAKIIAYERLQQAIDTGVVENLEMSDADKQRVADELDRLTQRMFEQARL